MNNYERCGFTKEIGDPITDWTKFSHKDSEHSVTDTTTVTWTRYSTLP